MIVDSGNGEGKGASKITGYVTDIISSLPETVEALTGVDLKKIVSNRDLFKELENKKDIIEKEDQVNNE